MQMTKDDVLAALQDKLNIENDLKNKAYDACQNATDNEERDYQYESYQAYKRTALAYKDAIRLINKIN